ncbi:uncharacterized protein LOC106058754 [Biomphalaria glabrata]|uniref:Uncharacterized protein LOC106058754 n=1 Tax=Biomphalaria glabrata TaxID=6526 RepID=A0A9W2YRS8_BIOGL|nr:uncharacterized protein LOC106058754 [Biomphalaria glabrata]
MKPFMKCLVVTLRKSTQKISKKLPDLSQVDNASLLAKGCFGKNQLLSMIYVSQCIKKLFTTMNIDIVRFLEQNLVKIKSTFSFGLSEINPMLQEILFHGLTHFVTYCLREGSHIMFVEVCERILRLIGSVSKQPLSEVPLLQQVLLFDPPPKIHKAMEELLKKENSFFTNPKCLTSFLVTEIERCVCPYLSVELEHLTTNCQESKEMRLIGTFQQRDAIVNVLKDTLPGQAGSSSHASQSQFANMICLHGQLTHENILKLFAYRINGTLQFYITEYYKTSLQEYLVNKSLNRKLYHEKTLLQYLLQVALALEYCHQEQIVHCDLTAANMYVDMEDRVKLSNFHLALKVTNSEEARLDVTKEIAVHWSSPETLKDGSVSKKSDVSMFGCLMYEVLSHGVMPYSREKLSVQEYIQLAVYYLVSLHRESCFKEDYYNLMLSCTHYCPKQRPCMTAVRSQLQLFLDNYSSRDFTNYNYPDLQKSCCLKSSIELVKAAPQLEKNKIPVLPRKKSSIDEYKLGQYLLFKEKHYNIVSKTLIRKLQNGALDRVVSKVNVISVGNTQRTEFVIDVLIPSSCTGSLMSLMVNRKIEQTTEVCIALTVAVAEMLGKIHDSEFVYGELKLSNLFLDKTNGITKVYPISLKHLDLANSVSSRGRDKSMEIVGSKERDIFYLGLFMKELFCQMNSEQTIETIYETLPGDMITGIDFPCPRNCPQRVYDLILQCLSGNPRTRPALLEILRRVQTVLSLFFEVVFSLLFIRIDF